MLLNKLNSWTFQPFTGQIQSSPLDILEGMPWLHELISLDLVNPTTVVQGPLCKLMWLDTSPHFIYLPSLAFGLAGF